MSSTSGPASEPDRLRLLVDIARRHREHAQQQARLLREIEHLRETARMLFEDKPDKTKAVEAVNDIAERKAAHLGEAARALLLDSERSPLGGDRCDRLLWTLRINRAGHFPYTGGIDAHEATQSLWAEEAAVDAWPETAVQQLATALADGWACLADSAEGGQSAPDIAFDEHRDAAHRALAGAARRLWAVVAREGLGAHGAALQLRLQGTVIRTPVGSLGTLQSLQPADIDAAEDRLIEALLRAQAPGSQAPAAT